jgi:hypothetical protein
MEAKTRDEVMKALVREGTAASPIPEDCRINTEILLRHKAAAWASEKKVFSLLQLKPIPAAFAVLLAVGLGFWGASTLLFKPQIISGLSVVSNQGGTLQNNHTSVSRGYGIREKDSLETGTGENIIIRRADDLSIRLFPESVLAFTRYSTGGDTLYLELERGSVYINKTFSSRNKELSAVQISGYTFQLIGTRVYFSVTPVNGIIVICYDGAVQVMKKDLIVGKIEKEEKITIQKDGTLVKTGSRDWQEDEWKPDRESSGRSSVFESGDNPPSESENVLDTLPAATLEKSESAQSKKDLQGEKSTPSRKQVTESGNFNTPSPAVSTLQTVSEYMLPVDPHESDKKIVDTLDTDFGFRKTFYQKIANLDVKGAAFTDVLNAFGEPLLFSWNGTQLDRNSLPADFIMNYPDRFSVYIENNKVKQLRYSNPGYTFTGGLQIGASMEAVLQVMGKPVKIVTGGTNKEEDRILYRDIDGVVGRSCYMNAGMGMTAFFTDDKLVEMIILAGN